MNSDYSFQNREHGIKGNPLWIGKDHRRRGVQIL